MRNDVDLWEKSTIGEQHFSGDYKFNQKWKLCYKNVNLRTVQK